MIAWHEILIRLALACLFGAAVGLERQRKDWAAGMRTHMMVCLGACLIMVVSAFGFSDVLGTPHVELDPSRVAAQVVSGIGFIGAGTIMFLKQKVIRGLTTAAGLWTVAAIGLAVGGGMYFAAFITTVFAIVILWMIQPLERRLSSKFKIRYVRLTFSNRADTADLLDKILNQKTLGVESLNFEEEGSDYIVDLKFNIINEVDFKKLVVEFQSNPNIKEIAWDR